MSYSQEVIAVRDTVFEYRYIVVSHGDPAPEPAVGYTISPVLSDVAGKDVYLEYRTFEQEHA